MTKFRFLSRAVLTTLWLGLVLFWTTMAVACEDPRPSSPLANQALNEKPVKVYLLSGQSNMVGIGQVSSGGTRWGA